jgi:hypothetical protein
MNHIEDAGAASNSVSSFQLLFTFSATTRLSLSERSRFRETATLKNSADLRPSDPQNSPCETEAVVWRQTGMDQADQVARLLRLAVTNPMSALMPRTHCKR